MIPPKAFNNKKIVILAKSYLRKIVKFVLFIELEINIPKPL
ncbi:conserved hypothetical protein (plasmid) [Borreliella bissettiae DN127]|uniref:Uncharacterized protein n=2 Tax=Borreliella TaxID=64895 RepID=A0A7X0DK31_9SPIR|nr:conserved hypothetical protein [Borreliella bissettiae DN127]MBB6208518.1 hypothetical protein [Borreliella lanei]